MRCSRRSHLQIHARKFNGSNQSDLTSFAISVTTGELKEFGFSLAAIGRLLSRVVLADLSHKTEQFELREINDQLTLIPRRDDYDEEFLSTVTSWD